MTLNGRNVTLGEIKSFYGAHYKIFNEDRAILSAAKCRPMILVNSSVFLFYSLGQKFLRAACFSLSPNRVGLLMMDVCVNNE